MKAVAQVEQGRESGAGRAIIAGGAAAGTLDILAALINSGLRGVGPGRVLQTIAGGLVGRAAAVEGGMKTAALGLALHFLIATSAAAVYYAASLKLPALKRRAVVCGMLYGVAVYLFMYTVVLPLSALQTRFFSQAATAILTSLLIHIFCVGLPIALATRRFAQTTHH